jgi:hypothetical protein
MWIWVLFLACEQTPTGVPDPATFLPTQVDTGEEAPEKDTGDEIDGNLPPKIRQVQIVPSSINTRTDVRVKAKVEDPESDPIRMEIQWFVNGVKRVRDTSRVLDSSRFRKKDKLTVQVTVTDGTHTRKRMSPVVEVENSPPEFAMRTGSLPKLDGFIIRASDPDDDPLVFKLENPPPGLSIDQEGELSFEGSEVTEGGTFETRIIVEDDDGQQVIWPLTVTLTAGQKAARVPIGEEAEKGDD